MVTKIEQPITDFYADTGRASGRAEPAMYDRPEVVSGKTYKIRPPLLGCAMYVTINNIELEDGTLRPFEIFIASKSVQNHQWVTALTRMISAVFRKPGDVSFVVEELMQVFDPQGGYWEDGQMVPSVVAHIGLVLKRHIAELGGLPEMDEHRRQLIADKRREVEEKGITDDAMFCQSCGEQALHFLDGCWTCISCGDSRCN